MANALLDLEELTVKEQKIDDNLCVLSEAAAQYLRKKQPFGYCGHKYGMNRQGECIYLQTRYLLPFPIPICEHCSCGSVI